MHCCYSCLRLSWADDVPAYRLAANDALTIAVTDNPNVGGQVVVAPDGTIQLPIVGTVFVGDLTLQDATKKLTDLYARRLVHPEVSIMLTNHATCWSMC